MNEKKQCRGRPCGSPRHYLNLNNYSKKAGNARRRLLAYPSFSYIETMQNGKVDFE